jgi:tetratricopeptide (TPR) repeat protein
LYGDEGETELSAESVRKAYGLRDRASDREKFFITFHYDRQITGNLERALQTLEVWAQSYPRDVDAISLQSGFSSQGTGRYQKTIQAAESVLKLDPDFGPAYDNLASANLYLERLEEAEKVTQRLSARLPEHPDVFVLRYRIAFLKGERAAMDAEVARAAGKRGVEDWISQAASMVAARSGRLQEARKLSRHAIDLAREAEEPERAAIFAAAAAVWEGFYGNARAAHLCAAAGLILSLAREVEYGAALGLALTGDAGRSQKLADDIEKRFPEATAARYSYLPVLRGFFAIQKGAPQTALELLQPAVPYDLAAPATIFHGFFGALYPAYMRGVAYLAAHQPAEAAAEFRKVIDHPGLVFADPVGTMARIQLGRAYALAGDKEEAKAAYQDFFTLWKDADPDVAVLKQAKAEFARL